MLKRNYFLVGGCCLFYVLSFICTTAIAQISVIGLEENKDLQTYLQEKVIVPLKQEERQNHVMGVRAKLQRGLRARGYYDARITAIEKDGEMVFDIQTGVLYKISSYHISGYDAPPELSIRQQDPLVAKAILDAQKDLLRFLLKNECFYNVSVSHRALLDHVRQSAEVTFDVEVSDPAVFGETFFEGADNIKRSYLQHFITYEEKACWKAKELEDTKEALMGSGLIGTLDAELPDILEEDSTVPVVFKLKERAPRNVKLGAHYNTSQGLGVSAKWTHRNFFGAGEELSVGTHLSAVQQRLGMDFSKPFFMSDRQSLKFSSVFEREESDAYDEMSLNISSSIERTLSKNWTGSLGVGLETSQISEDGGPTDNFGLVFVPATLTYDSRDDILNPHDGHTLSLLATPFIDAFGSASPFFKTRATGTTYFDLGTSFWESVIALRTSIGSLWGAAADDIPASRRFYAGGGGSIRGFGYQEAGPVDADNDPAGGRSLFETNLEFRTKFSKTIGGVVFVDGGGVYDSPIPDFEGGAYIGAGVGVRYYTDFGPVRLDVGVPLNKKKNLDQGFQVYMSIGQAF